jgi:hypothetical protein
MTRAAMPAMTPPITAPVEDFLLDADDVAESWDVGDEEGGVVNGDKKESDETSVADRGVL